MKTRENISIANLIIGYVLAATFIILMIMNTISTKENHIDIVENVESNTTITQEYIVYRDLPSAGHVDRLNEVVINHHEDIFPTIANPSDRINILDDERVHTRSIHRDIHHDDVGDRVNITKNNDTHIDLNRQDTENEALIVDTGLLDRRLRDLEKPDRIGIDVKDDVNLGNLSPVNDESDVELGDVSNFNTTNSVKFGLGGGGQLYAYNFPSYGVGAGVGSGTIGAGGGLGAGLSAGLGQSIMKESPVPTLGGVGSGSPGDVAPGSGSGGLTNGAGAGAAAGLMTGKVVMTLGALPVGTGQGNGGYNYDHLPENGALHIMMHVDGSGSILRTRKQLEIMKDTLLKDALLPYYNNDVSLYNRRVIIMDSSGERTLKFFTKATEKNNVLAVVFQDEAQPDYHLPNFNKQPESHYSKDLQNLKASLNGYRGLYRGVMFQVGDKVFSKSFKEFISNAWRGEGYLKGENLSDYYWQENKSNIINKTGVVFSDEYHANPVGDPKYYLDLIFSASRKVGLDLSIQAAGLTDGKKVY